MAVVLLGCHTSRLMRFFTHLWTHFVQSRLAIWQAKWSDETLTVAFKRPRYDGKLDVPKKKHHPRHHSKQLSGHRSVKKHHTVNHLKVSEIKEIPSCGEEYTCDAHRSIGDAATKHMAVHGPVVFLVTTNRPGRRGTCSNEIIATIDFDPCFFGHGLFAEVYTYNIGSYEGGMRDDNIPCVPSNVDAPEHGRVDETNFFGRSISYAIYVILIQANSSGAAFREDPNEV